MSYGTKFCSAADWAELYERQRAGERRGGRVPVHSTHALVNGDPLLVEFFKEAMENARQDGARGRVKDTIRGVEVRSAPPKEVKRGKKKAVADRAGRGRRK